MIRFGMAVSAAFALGVFAATGAPIVAAVALFWSLLTVAPGDYE